MGDTGGSKRKKRLSTIDPRLSAVQSRRYGKIQARPRILARVSPASRPSDPVGSPVGSPVGPGVGLGMSLGVRLRPEVAGILIGCLCLGATNALSLTIPWLIKGAID